MSDNNSEILRRALAWWERTAEHGRPDKVDVEVLVRLGIRDAAGLDRLIWNDIVALGRHFGSLLAVIESSTDETQGIDDEVDAPARRVAAAGAGAAEDDLGPTTSGPPPGRGSDSSDLRVAALLEYLDQCRARGDDVGAMDPAWIQRALDDPSGAISTLKAKVRRNHEAKLLAILTGKAGAPRTGSSDRPRQPTAEDCTSEPDIHIEHVPERRVDFRWDDDDTTSIVWPRPPASVAYFRVIAGHDDRRPQLFHGRSVGLTADLEIEDVEPLRHGRRHYAVWAYTGEDEQEAASSAPVLWAEGIRLQPVHDIRVTVNESDVYAVWTSSPAVERVEVYRVPLAAAVPAHIVPEQHLISGSVVGENLKGFRDRDVPADEYEYRYYACATVDGMPLRSSPVIERREVSVRVPVIEDLVVEEVAGSGDVRISWTLPGGDGIDVEIHRSPVEPPAGVQDRELDADALVRSGFDTTTMWDVVPARVGDRTEFVEAWPTGFDRLHVTAVTRAGGWSRVGATAVLTRVGSVHDAVLRERVDEQFLTFRWPPGAGFVEVRVRPDPLADDDCATWPLADTIRRVDHERHGGHHLTKRLPAAGTDLALTGIAFQGGQREAGPSTVVRYPGLVRLRYRFQTTDAGEERRGLFRRRVVASGCDVRVDAEAEIDVPVVLVHLRDRLPLHHREGRVLETGRLTLDAAGSRTIWDGLDRPEEPSGYVRLFLDLPDDQQRRFAVLDPDLEELRW